MSAYSYAFLHPITREEISDMKIALGCAKMRMADFVKSVRLEGDDELATSLGNGHKMEVARITRNYLPDDIKKEEYRNGEKAWLHLRARLNIYYHEHYTPSLVSISVHMPDTGREEIHESNIYYARFVSDLCRYLLYRRKTSIPDEFKERIDHECNRIPRCVYGYVPNVWRPRIEAHMYNTYMDLTDDE